MEELRSTDVLDREILEDARRKAQRILKSADEAAAAATAAWEKKAEELIAAARARYAEKLEQSRVEIMARLPMDKRRSRIAQIESFLRTGMEAYIAGLGRDKIIALLTAELGRRVAVCPGIAGVPFEVRFRGLERAEVERLLKELFPGGSWTAEESSLHHIPGSFPALVIDSADVRVTAAVDEAAEALLKDKRAELAAALLGAAFFEEAVPDKTPPNPVPEVSHV
jgi:hypothetical protein